MARQGNSVSARSAGKSSEGYGVRAQGGELWEEKNIDSFNINEAGRAPALLPNTHGAKTSCG